jgi:hypothetical protein
VWSGSTHDYAECDDKSIAISLKESCYESRDFERSRNYEDINLQKSMTLEFFFGSFFELFREVAIELTNDDGDTGIFVDSLERVNLAFII